MAQIDILVFLKKIRCCHLKLYEQCTKQASRCLLLNRTEGLAALGRNLMYWLSMNWIARTFKLTQVPMKVFQQPTFASCCNCR